MGSKTIPKSTNKKPATPKTNSKTEPSLTLTALESSSEPIERVMRNLKLSGIAKNWRDIEYTGNTERYLRNLFEMELTEREANRNARMVKTAGFSVIKTLKDFAWKTTIEIPRGITQKEIESGGFIRNKENLILMGSVGTGKTHLATAIGLKLCESGKQVRFYTAASLANILLEKNQRGGLNTFINSLKKVELMIIDEIGFIPLHKKAAELLFQVVSDCHERKSLIITTNLEFSQWNTVFGDNHLTAALIDRLIHHSHILLFTGENHRLQESIKRQKNL